LHYLVVDGGSTDGTLDMLRSYGDRIRWVSRPDTGQADAVARGILELGGEYVTYLNADDTLSPRAIATLARALTRVPEAAVAYGNALHIDAHGNTIGPYPTQAFDAPSLLRACFICQPAALIRRSSYDEVGGMDTQLQYAMDYQLWLRLAQRGPFIYVPVTIAHSRMHPENKTLAHRKEVYLEIFKVLRAQSGYVPYEWIAGYSDYLLHRSDQFFERAPASRLTALLALFLGLGINKRRMQTYLREWYAYRSLGTAWTRT
jgi:GT2 family glycosyltransferase